MLRACLVQFAFTVLAVTGQAQAPGRATLGWVRGPGAESCIGPVELGQRVERIVGPVLSPASEGQLAVEARIERVGAHYVATIAVSDASGRRLGTREVKSEGDDCRTFDDSLAFVIAVTIDPDAALSALPGDLAEVDDPGGELLASIGQQPATQAASFARVAPKPRPEPAAARPTVERERLAQPILTVGVGPSAVVGAMPALAAGPRAELGFRTGAFWHRAGLAFSAAQRESLSGMGSTQLGALGLSASSCFELLQVARFALAPCLGVEVVRLWAEPRGFVGTTQRRWLFGPAAGARLGVALWGPLHFALLGMAHPAWPGQRVVYEVAGDESLIHRTAPIMGQLVLSLELRF